MTLAASPAASLTEPLLRNSPEPSGAGSPSPVSSSVSSIASEAIARTRTPQNSQVKWPALLTTVAIGGTTALLALHPFGWVITAIVAGSVFLLTISLNGLNYQMKAPIDKQMMAFEFTSLLRNCGLRGDNYNEINLEGLQLRDGRPIPEGAKLIVSALPNRKSKWNSIPDGKIGIVVANLQEEELYPRGPAQVLVEDDWQNRDPETQFYLNLTDDHALVTTDKLDQVADRLYQDGIAKGKQAITHCRGGVGRSATGAAACMLKYFVHKDGTPLTIEEVCVRIQTSRTKSTVKDKLDGLVAFSESLTAKEIPQAEISSELRTYADALAAARASGKKPKLSKARAKVLFKDVKIPEKTKPSHFGSWWSNPIETPAST